MDIKYQISSIRYQVLVGLTRSYCFETFLLLTHLLTYSPALASPRGAFAPKKELMDPLFDQITLQYISDVQTVLVKGVMIRVGKSVRGAQRNSRQG